MTQWFLAMDRILTMPLFLSILKVTCTNGCRKGWMGPNCRFKCRCKTDCLLTGECVANSACQENYFGEACQYQDQVKFNPDRPNLTDSDDSTCMLINNERVFFWPTRLTFIRILVKDEESFVKIRIAIKDGRHGFACEPTDTYIQVRPHVRDYYCITKERISHVDFISDMTGSLCTVNINGGRNLALAQQYNVSSSVSQHIGGVDGEYPPNNSTRPTDNHFCVYTNETEPSGTFTVWLNVPLMIYSFVIINVPVVSDQLNLNGFHLYTYNSTNATIMRHVDNSTEEFYLLRIPNTVPDEPVSSVRLVKNKTDNSRALEFCELEAYGDCARGFYGLDCTSKCGKCEGGSCRLYGECIGGQCDVGAYGPMCDKACGSNCGGAGGCNIMSGACSDGCKAGFIGAMCTERTPETVTSAGNVTVSKVNCSGNGSCESNCADGMYGVNCSMTCSKNCGGKKACQKETGKCNEGCSTGFGGSNCSNDCSYCIDGLCDRETVRCNKGCKEGSQNSMCATAQDPTSGGKIAIFYIVVIVLFACLLCLGMFQIMSRSDPHLQWAE